jgi:hypothetical protein
MDTGVLDLLNKKKSWIIIFAKNNERPDWMTDLKHTDSAW